MNFVPRDHDLNFQDQPFQVAIFTSKRWRNANITIAIGWDVSYLPSNGATVNVTHLDSDLHFQNHEF